MRSTVYSAAANFSFLLAMLVPCLALAKRSVPAEVPPVVDGNVRYAAPHGGFGSPANPCGQIGGCVVAYDNTTGALLWSLEVYSITYDPDVEEDVQWVFIISLALEDGRLLVSNERGQCFTIDRATRDVAPGPCRCDTGASGCAGGSDGGSAWTGDAASASGPAVSASSGCSIACRRAPPVAMLASLATIGAGSLLARRKRRRQ
jgi:hypothetical protein